MMDRQLIYGFHAIEEALKKRHRGADLMVSGRSKRISALIALAEQKGCRVRNVSREELDNLSKGVDHRGVLLFLSDSVSFGKKPTTNRDFDTALQQLATGEEQALILLLDGITDPQNLGAILRSADQFAVDLVVLPERRSAGDGAVVDKVSAGASLHVPRSVVPNIPRAVEGLKKAGFWVYGADMGGDSAWNLSLKGKVAIVLGAEGRGIGRLVRERCDEIISIPSRGHIDSFNVSVAGGILLYECRRQQWSD